jgi:hypothetical protein
MIVKTANSTYKVDEENKIIVRFSKGHNRGLRRDDDEVSYFSIDEPKVDHHWDMVLNIREDGVVTLRRTSLVREILRGE